MKFTKLSILAGTATGALFLAGCTIPGQQLQNREQEQTQEQVQNEMKEMAQIMEKGGSAYCELIDKEGNKLEYWLKDKKMKAKGQGFSQAQMQAEEQEQNQNQVGMMINDGSWLYTWSEGQTQGFKMKMPTEAELKEMEQEAKEMADKLPDFTDETTVQEYEDQGYRVNCQKRNVADSEFTPPSNIQFQDYSALMQDAQKMGQNALEAVDQDQMKELQRQAEEMQKKYGQQ